MPNIEICGIAEIDSRYQTIKKIIFSSLNKKELKDVVFTFHQAYVEDVNGFCVPYVRISDTNKKRAKRIAKLLKNVIDVEILVLTKFVPKK
jgi:formyltetrahydrofolate hydrolase